MAAEALAPPDSTRSSFLISPSPSPGPPSRSPSPSFLTAPPSDRASPSPTKRKRQHDYFPNVISSPSHSHSTASVSRSDSTSTSVSSGPFSSRSSDDSGIPFLKKDAKGHDRTPSRSPPKKPQIRVKTKIRDEEKQRPNQTREQNTEVECIGGGGMPDRAMEMAVGGVRRRKDSEPKVPTTPTGEGYRQWKETTRLKEIEGPESPRNIVSKRMFELGLVDNLERSASTRTNSSTTQSTDSNESSMRDQFFDILGEEYPAPPPKDIAYKPEMMRNGSFQYKLKAMYSPCPTLVRVPTVEMVEDPKLWPATISTPVSASPHPSAKRRKRSQSPPSPALAPRPISPSKANSTSSSDRTAALPGKTGGNCQPVDDQPQTRPSSPPLPTPENPNPLTWHATEITGHLIDYENGDDGTGINGVGFKPTKFQEDKRREKRKRQIDEWRRREDQHARNNRTKARAEMKEGFGLIGVGMQDRDGAINGAGRKVVKFA